MAERNSIGACVLCGQYLKAGDVVVLAQPGKGMFHFFHSEGGE